VSPSLFFTAKCTFLCSGKYIQLFNISQTHSTRMLVEKKKSMFAPTYETLKNINFKLIEKYNVD